MTADDQNPLARCKSKLIRLAPAGHLTVSADVRWRQRGNQSVKPVIEEIIIKIPNKPTRVMPIP